MDCFGPTELVFNRTYFTKKYQRIVRIKGDAHLSGFSNVEVEPTGGCFTFLPHNLGFENRFIIWRAENSNLFLDEYSADHVLKDSNICINLGHSIIIPGVKMFTHMGMLVLFIPTQATIHRIAVRIARDDVVASQRSILSLFPREDELPLMWDCRHYETKSTAVKAEVNLSNSGNAHIGLSFLDGQLVSLEYPFQQAPDMLKEVTLQENRRLTNLLWRNQDDNSAIDDVTSYSNGDDVLFFSVYKDGKLKVWSGNEKRLLYKTSISTLLTITEKFKADSYRIKIVNVNEVHPVVVVVAQMQTEARFFFLRWLQGQNCTFEAIVAHTLCGKQIHDFLTLSGKKDNETYTLWAISREAFDPNKSNASFQPYLLWKCGISSDMKTTQWERIQPAVDNQSLDELKFAFPRQLNAIKHRIFNGESYSFDVVSRALQVVCKRGPVLPQQYNDWSALVNYVDEYVSSNHFIQGYLSEEDKSSLYVLNLVNTTTSQQAVDKFYEKLLRNCDEFQEEGLQAYGLWHSPLLDLVGVIQQCRFTVYHKGDYQMQQIARSTDKQKQLEECLAASFLFLKHDQNTNDFLSNQEQLALLSVLINNDEEICNVIRLFAEHCPIDEVNCKPYFIIHSTTDFLVKPTKNEYMGSMFTTGYLSMVLRHRLLRRFKFANLVIGMTKLVTHLARNVGSNDFNIELRQTLLKDKTSSHDVWEGIIRTHDSTLLQIAGNYRIMWSALDFRLTKHLYTHRTPEDGSHRLTICQAFFQLGGGLVKRLNTLGADFASDDDSSSSDSNELAAPSYESDYSTFVREIVDGALVILWPESTYLTLPYFLAERGYAETLSKYCYDNEPFIVELAHAFRFYQGIAYSIQRESERAIEAFNDVIEGIKSGDDALNMAISQLLKEEVNKRARRHTISEYYKLVMDLLRSYGLLDESLIFGKKIIDGSETNDSLLPSVYTELFKIHVSRENFSEAVVMIIKNPGKDEKNMCLRELITQMINKKKYRELVSLNFDGLINTVADHLERNCLTLFFNWDSPVFQTMYSFYVNRHMYVRSARLYIEYSFRLSTEIQSNLLIEKRCGILATTIGLVQMTDGYKFDLIGTVPEPTVKSNEPLICQIYRSDSPPLKSKKNEFKVVVKQGNEKIEGELIDLKYLRNEHMKTEARLALARKYETYTPPPINVREIAIQCIKYKLYDFAFMLCMTYDMEIGEIIGSVTYDCLQMDHEEQQLKNEVDFRLKQVGDTVSEITRELRRAKVSLEPARQDWVLDNRGFLVYTDEITIKPHWMLLYGYIHFALNRNPADIKAINSATYMCLKYSKPIPEWLLDLHSKKHLSDLLHCLIEYDELMLGLEVVDKHVAKQMMLLQKQQEKHPVDVPFSQIDVLYAYCKTSKDDNITLRYEKSRSKIVDYMKAYANFVKVATLDTRF